MNIGDKFIIDGPDEELHLHNLYQYKGTVRIITSIKRTSGIPQKQDFECYNFKNPVNPKGVDWYCPVNLAKPVSKLHKALA